MLLIEARRAASAIGSACKRYDGNDDKKLLELLRLITPRVEASCEVETLSRDTFTDTYLSPSGWTPGRSLSVGMANAFLTGNVSFEGVTFADDDPLGTANIINRKLGLVRLFPVGFSGRTFTATYTSGFDIPPNPVEPYTEESVHPDPMYRAGIDVPDWMAALVVTVLIKHYRSKIAAPIIPKDIGIRGLSDEVNREIKNIVYKSFMRPRFGILYPEASVAA